MHREKPDRSSPLENALSRRIGEAFERFAERPDTIRPALFGRQIGLAPLVQLLRRVGASLRAGIDARKVWEHEARSGPAAYRPTLSEIHRRLAQGDSLNDAVRDAGEFFPSLVCEMVDVGEQTGKLDEVLLGLADHYEHVRQLRRTFLIGIAWPTIQLLIAIVIVGFLIWIVGVIADSLGGDPIDFLGFGLTGGRGLTIYCLLVAAAATTLTAIVLAIRRGWLGDAGWQAAMRIPLVGRSLQTNALARFTWTLSLSLGAGADARKSLRMALRSTQLPLYTAWERKVDEEILRGVEFHEALRATGVFPNDFLHALEAAEISGRLSESMQLLSQDYTQRAQDASRTLTVASTFVIYGGVLALLVFLIFRIFLTYVGKLTELTG